MKCNKEIERKKIFGVRNRSKFCSDHCQRIWHADLVKRWKGKGMENKVDMTGRTFVYDPVTLGIIGCTRRNLSTGTVVSHPQFCDIVSSTK